MRPQLCFFCGEYFSINLSTYSNQDFPSMPWLLVQVARMATAVPLR
jgi:hypothetical protein